MFIFIFFSLGDSCNGYFLWLLVVIFGGFFFFFSLSWWLLLVVGLVIFLMGFGGWHGDGYCGCGGGC